MDFKIGQKYTGINFESKELVSIKITSCDKTWIYFDVLSGNVNFTKFMYRSVFANILVLITDKPHICDYLGNGKSLEVGEVFGFEAGKFLVDEKGLINVVGNGWTSSNRFCNMVNHPEKITRQPQFSATEIVGLKALVMFEFPYLARDEDNGIWGFQIIPYKRDYDWASGETTVKLSTTLFPQIKWTDNEPFSIVGYLEGLK